MTRNDARKWRANGIQTSGKNGTAGIRPGNWSAEIRDVYKRQLHILYQSDLRPGAVQIMPWAMDLEIHIPLQIVGQEAHAALHGHQLGAHGEHLNFLLGQAAAAAFQIAVRIAVEQIQIQGNPA